MRSSSVIPGQYVVNEFPKCGGTWLSQLLEKSAGVPYPRLRLPRIGKNILHGHYLNAVGIRAAIVMWRDPRDVLVSHFHHCTRFTPITSAANVRRNRSLIGLSDDDQIDFERHFIRYLDLMQSRSIHPYFTLQDFYKSWFGRQGVEHTSYERLHLDGVNELVHLSSLIFSVTPEISDVSRVVEELSFKRVSGREAGVESSASFLRKGVMGDWQNVLLDDVLGRVNSDFGDEIKLFEQSGLSVAR